MDDGGFTDRYTLRALLGQGGMGEVHLCHDERIGRDVAMKRIRAGRGEDAGVRARFRWEGRVQGQLEHPAIVPVYDLALGPSGEAYFTMKRVRGIGLDEVVDRLQEGDTEMARRFSRRRLLMAFSQVCLAIDFAHQRGVLHRDLKPPNIMLGDFGEVYVLDWGVAKRVGMADPEGPDRDERVIAPAEGAAHTVAGALVGTPGYMAPEQVRGEAGALSPRTDVYALGAILFELLTLQPLHRRTTPVGVLAATIAGADARASVRCPEAEVPPELEAICTRATALDPGERFPAARALHEAVERFLDGDRDLELRRQLARSSVQAAQEAADLALQGGPSTELRERALREVGRALALDPKDPTAVRTLVRLLATPPREVPAEARVEMAREGHERAHHGQRIANRLSLLINVSLLPVLFWMGPRSWIAIALCTGLLGAGMLLGLVSTWAGWSQRRMGIGAVLMQAPALLAGSRLFGPLVLVPAVAVSSVALVATLPDRKLRMASAATVSLTMVLMVALEWIGVLPRSYLFHDGRMQVLPQMFFLPEVPTLCVLLLASVSSILAASSYIGQLRDGLTETEERLRLQMWQLSRLVPEEARKAQ